MHMHQIPFSRFEGFIKRLDFSALAEDEKAVANFAFPGFFTEPTHLKHEKYLYPIAKRMELMDLIYGAGNRRRYSPGAFLPRGMYYSLLNEPFDSGDSGTMRGEMNAYRDPVLSGYVQVVDFTNNQRDPSSSAFYDRDANGTVKVVFLTGMPGAAFVKKLIIILYDQEKFKEYVGADKFKYMQSVYPGVVSNFESNLSNSFFTRNLVMEDQEQGAVAPFLALQLEWDIKRVRIERLVDFRRPEVQQWFFEYFRSGIPGFLSRPLYGSSFSSSLPMLMLPRIGGGQLTTAFGLWAFMSGVDAIIYPSARNDVRVVWSGNDVVEYEGWNLVDFRLNCDDLTSGKIRENFDSIVNHERLQGWLDDDMLWDAPYFHFFLKHTTTLQDPHTGFEVKGVNLLNERLYLRDYEAQQSRWRESDVALSAFDKSVVELLRKNINRQESVLNTQLYRRYRELAKASLRSENKSARKIADLVCDICGKPVTSDAVYFLHGKLIAARNFISETTRANAAQKGMSIEDAQARLMARAHEDVTPWAVCGSCVNHHLGTPEEKNAAKEIAMRYFSGKTIELTELPVTSALVQSLPHASEPPLE